MADRCKNCGEKFVKYPIKDENGKLIIKNLFKMDMMSVFFLICVILLLIGYKLDMNQCDDAINRPCEFCKNSNCCVIAIGNTEDRYIFDVPKLNLNITN